MPTKQIDIDSLTASRELDELIDVHVMKIGGRKHVIRECEDFWYSYCTLCGKSGSSENDSDISFEDQGCLGYPKYSTSISAAWPVGCKFTTFGILYDDATCTWIAKLDPRRNTFDGCKYSAIGDTAPEAICLAALQHSKLNSK